MNTTIVVEESMPWSVFNVVLLAVIRRTAIHVGFVFLLWGCIYVQTRGMGTCLFLTGRRGGEEHCWVWLWPWRGGLCVGGRVSSRFLQAVVAVGCLGAFIQGAPNFLCRQYPQWVWFSQPDTEWYCLSFGLRYLCNTWKGMRSIEIIRKWIGLIF